MVVAVRELYVDEGFGHAVEVDCGYFFVGVCGRRDVELASPGPEYGLSFDFIAWSFVALDAEDATMVGDRGVVDLEVRLFRAASRVWGSVLTHDELFEPRGGHVAVEKICMWWEDLCFVEWECQERIRVRELYIGEIERIVRIV
jgi:hypothetical protein